MNNERPGKVQECADHIRSGQWGLQNPTDDERPCPTCGTCRLRSVERVAAEHDFTYNEALNYVIVIGLAHLSRRQNQEPGA